MKDDIDRQELDDALRLTGVSRAQLEMDKAAEIDLRNSCATKVAENVTDTKALDLTGKLNNVCVSVCSCVRVSPCVCVFVCVRQTHKKNPHFISLTDT